MIDHWIYDIIYTSLRCLLGLGFGAITAIVIAAVFQIVPSKARMIFELLIDYIRSIPILAIVPLVAWFCGPSEIGKFIIIALATGCIITKHMIDIIGEPHIDLELTLKSMGISNGRRWVIYFWPRLRYSVVSGIRVALGVAWISVVAAEMTGIFRSGLWSGGLGYRLTIFYENSDWKGMMTIILLFGILGVLSAKIMDLFLGIDPSKTRNSKS